MKVEVNVVVLKDPCAACFIIGGLVKEMFDKFQKEMDFIKVEYIELENLKNLHLIKGLEVENFPAVIINEEQITAGSIPDKREIVKRLVWENKKNEC